jgi:hypothetical protein
MYWHMLFTRCLVPEDNIPVTLGVDLLKERTDNSDFNVHGYSLMLLIEAMPEFAKDLGEEYVEHYACLKMVDHIIHKPKLSEWDIKNFLLMYRRAFDAVYTMHSRTYLHVGYHFVDLIEKGIAVGNFNCQRRSVEIEYAS